MSSIIFTYNGVQTSIQCNKEDKLKDICSKFWSKNPGNKNNIYYVYGGKILDLNLTFNEVTNNKNDINNKINVLILNEENNSLKNDTLIKSKEIICPKCFENCLLSFIDYKINLSDCKNGHITKNISFEEFDKTQFIDESKIICNFCNNSKNNTYQKILYKCLSCNKNLCPLCNTKHDKQHITIDYDKKNYVCNMHNESFISYCEKCRKDLCFQCGKEHNNHSVISYSNIMNEDKIKNNLKEFKIKIDIINDDIRKMIEILTTVRKNMELFYKINSDILNNYEVKKRNYEIFRNINFIEKNIKNQEIDEIINDDNLVRKFKKILNINNKIRNIQNEMTIIYKISDSRIQLFSSDFVNNNKDNCILYINGKESKLVEYLDVKDINKKKELTIKLKEIKPITDMSRMFRDCTFLIYLPDFSEWDTRNVNNMHSLFNGCYSLYNLPDFSKWNASNVTDIGYMFWGCISLETIPDMSKWDVSKVKTMKGLFKNCSTIKTLPDISKWDTSNVNDMSSIFHNCASLEYLPDISKWDTSNVNDMSSIFHNCNSLKNLPDLSGWNINKVINMSYLFTGCSSLTSLPDFSKWKFNKDVNRTEMFKGLNKSIHIPF